MLVVKQGYSHRIDQMNCQDAAKIIYPDHVKVVCDGCSEGKHSEVGANAFVEIFTSRFMKQHDLGKKPDVRSTMFSTMQDLVNLFGSSPEVLKDYLSFTSLVVIKDRAFFCGDGYLIVNRNDDISFKKLDCGEYPEYLIYNFIDSNYLKEYKDGVDIKEESYYAGSADLSKLGVASDGIRFIVDRPDDDPLKKEFIDILKTDRDIKMKLFINRNEKIFQDDVSIAF